MASATPAGAIARAAPPDLPLAAKEAKLRKAAQQLEGAFVEQMFKAMRSTVPTDGMFDGGSGEEMFTGLMDQQIASETPGQWQRGLSDAVYRQLRGVLHRQAGVAVADEATKAASDTARTAAAASAGGVTDAAELVRNGLARATTD